MKFRHTSLILLTSILATAPACSSDERDFTPEEAGDGDGDGDGTGGSDDGTGGSDDGSGGSDDGSGGSDDGTGGSDDGSGGSDDGSGGSDDVDDTEPSVVGIAPSNGKSGVESDDPIVITFSEAMDEDATEDAISVSGVSSSLLNFAWDSASEIVSVTTAGGWDYAEGTSGSLSATEYTVLVTTDAADVAGNDLESSATSTFSTLRHITRTLTPVAIRNGNTYGMVVNTEAADVCTGTGTVNWFSSMSASGETRIWMDFNYGSLGSYSNVETVESATLSATQGSPESGYYPNGAVELVQLDYGPINVPGLRNYDEVTTLGLLADSAASSASLDLTSHVTSLWNAGTGNVLYKVTPRRGAQQSDNSADTFFECNSFELEVVYLAP